MSLDRIKPYAKAIVAFLAPPAVVLTSAVKDVSAGGSQITAGEWITAACACFITSGLVYGTPNRDPKALHQQESVQPPENHLG